MGRWLLRTLLGVAVALVLVALCLPLLVGHIGIPHNSRRFDDVVDDMECISDALKAFERSHEGRRPVSQRELRVHVFSARPRDEAAVKALSRLSWEYYPSAKPGEPVAACVFGLGSKPMIVTVDGAGVVRASRVWMWPTWQRRGASSGL